MVDLDPSAATSRGGRAETDRPLDALLVEIASNLHWQDLPQAVQDRVASLALDCLGCAVGGSKQPAVAALGRILQPARTDGGSVGLPWAAGDPVSEADAAMLLSTAAHALDFDDTHLSTSLHPTSPVFGPTLALAGSRNVTIGGWLSAVLVGIEVACRLGEVARPEDQYARGFHPSATCGALASAAACASLLRLDRGGIAASLGIALGGAGGTMQFLANDAQSKPLGIGFAARTGLIAARLAAEGLTGAADSIGGRAGFARMFGDGRVLGISPVRERWTVLEVGLKPYPSCRRGHALIEAAFQLRDTHPQVRDPGSVERIEFGASERSLDMIGRPLSDKIAPRSVAGVQFSGPVCIALALLRGQVGPRDLEQAMSDPAVSALASISAPVAEPRAGGSPETEFAGSLRIILKDGTEAASFVQFPSGEPDNFMARPEMIAKFDALADYAGLSVRGQAVEALLRESALPVATLLDLLTAGSASYGAFAL